MAGYAPYPGPGGGGLNIGPYINIPGLHGTWDNNYMPYQYGGGRRGSPSPAASSRRTGGRVGSPSNKARKAPTKATTAGGRKGSPSAAARKKTTSSSSKKTVKSAPQISLRALERDPRYGGTPSRTTSSGGTRSSGSSSSGSGGGGGMPAAPAAPPPPNPLDVLQTQLGNQLETLFSGLATTQRGIQEDYDARSAALLSQLEGYYAGNDATVKSSQAKSQQMLDELAGRIGMTGVTGTVDDLERRQAAERINQLNSTNQAASNANFDLIRNNYRDFLGDKVSQANASGVMAQVQMMDAINQLRAAQAAAASSGGGGGGGGGGRRRSGGGGGSSSGGISTSAAEGIISPPPTPPGPISGVRNLEPPLNWQGGRYGSPSIAVKRYPGVSNPSRAGFPRPANYQPPKPKASTAPKKKVQQKAAGKVVSGYGRKGSPSAGANSAVAARRRRTGK